MYEMEITQEKRDSYAGDQHVTEIPLNRLSSGKYQPRLDFNHTRLNELACSIKSEGVIHPLLVRKTTEEGHYEIIAGERRCRAAKIAGLLTVPAVVKDIDDSSAIAIALIENMQRDDLTSIEKAQGLKNLKDVLGLKNKQIAAALGKTERYVSELLGIFTLPEPIKELIDSGTTSPQTLAVLARCHKSNSQLTEDFISDKERITYRDASKFKDRLKSGKPDQDNDSPAAQVTVLYEGESWELVLNRQDQTGFCWIRNSHHYQRVQGSQLSIVSVM